VVRYAPLLYALNRAEILQYPQDGNIRRPWHTFWREARMAPQTRAKLVAEIAKLWGQQSDDLAEGMFCGWTVEQEAEHRKRADRLELLVRRLATLDEVTQRCA